MILNEEFLEFEYEHTGKRISALGNGNISIFNNSVKDRIWDANIHFSGSQFDNQNEDNNIELGIFEPNSNKILKYEIITTEELQDLAKKRQGGLDIPEWEAEQTLGECVKCGYSLRPGWTRCPVCETSVGVEQEQKEDSENENIEEKDENTLDSENIENQDEKSSDSEGVENNKQDS